MSEMLRPKPTRRSLLKAAGAGTVGATLFGHLVEARQSARVRRTFVLVHGAWHGGWCWRRVAERLRAAGHTVHTPTLTGLGERSHLLSADIMLETHILDVVNIFKFEDVENAVLCGHSYGGFIISGAVERVFSQVASIVFLDGLVPHDGQTGLDVATPMGRAGITGAVQRGAISRPAPTAAALNVNEADRRWVDAKMTPQPIRGSLEKITLTGARERVPKRAYIRTANYADETFDRFFAEAKAAGWRTFTIPSGHDAMIDAPDRLTDMLLDLA
jgi:pimeloyl-ACP methyl ester carboxylesterase